MLQLVEKTNLRLDPAPVRFMKDVELYSFNESSFQAGIINDDIVKKMPSRGRKRFVSEGDGGLIKDTSFFW